MGSCQMGEYTVAMFHATTLLRSKCIAVDPTEGKLCHTTGKGGMKGTAPDLRKRRCCPPQQNSSMVTPCTAHQTRQCWFEYFIDGRAFDDGI